MKAPQPRERFRALFEPRGIVLAGVANHPGKFGFVAYRNIRACGYGGAVAVRGAPIIASHPEVDAVIYLGLGIQSNTAAMERAGRFYPDHGLERITEYHLRQDARFAEAADAASRATNKPVIAADDDPSDGGRLGGC